MNVDKEKKSVSKAEVEQMIWEVDEDLDGKVIF